MDPFNELFTIAAIAATAVKIILPQMIQHLLHLIFRPTSSKVDASAHARRFQAEAQVRDMQHAFASIRHDVDQNSKVFVKGLQETVEVINTHKPKCIIHTNGLQRLIST